VLWWEYIRDPWWLESILWKNKWKLATALFLLSYALPLSNKSQPNSISNLDMQISWSLSKPYINLKQHSSTIKPNGNGGAEAPTSTTQRSHQPSLAPKPIRSQNQIRKMVQDLPTQLHLHHRAPRRHSHFPHHGLHPRRQRLHPRWLRRHLFCLRLPTPLLRPLRPSLGLQHLFPPRPPPRPLMQVRPG